MHITLRRDDPVIFQLRNNTKPGYATLSVWGKTHMFSNLVYPCNLLNIEDGKYCVYSYKKLNTIC